MLLVMSPTTILRIKLYVRSPGYYFTRVHVLCYAFLLNFYRPFHGCSHHLWQQRKKRKRLCLPSATLRFIYAVQDHLDCRMDAMIARQTLIIRPSPPVKQPMPSSTCQRTQAPSAVPDAKNRCLMSSSLAHRRECSNKPGEQMNQCNCLERDSQIWNLA